MSSFGFICHPFELFFNLTIGVEWVICPFLADIFFNDLTLSTVLPKVILDFVTFRYASFRFFLQLIFQFVTL